MKIQQNTTYLVPKRADLRTSYSHTIANSQNLKYLNSTSSAVPRTKRVKEIDKKIQILKEILRFKKAHNRFIQKSKQLEKETSDLPTVQKPHIVPPSNRPVAPVSWSFPKVHIFSPNPNFPLKTSLQPFSNIIVELMNHIYSPAFNSPVDYVRLNIPDYPVKIKRPMDLGTIKFRLENGKYSLPAEVIADIRQVWENSQTYNPPGNQFHKMALILSEMFEARIAESGFVDHQSGINNIDFSHINGGKKKQFDLSELDYDTATGEIIELSVYEKIELKKRISSISEPKILGTLVEIIRMDPKYGKIDSTKKLEFDVNSLSKKVARTLFKFINTVPNLKKIAKKPTHIDHNYHLKQIDTKISNEFSSDRSALLNSVINGGKISKVKSKPRESPSRENSPAKRLKENSEEFSHSEHNTSVELEKANYYSKLLEESSSTSDDESDEEETNKKGNQKTGNIKPSELDLGAKVMWNWNPNATKTTKANSAFPIKSTSHNTPFVGNHIGSFANEMRINGGTVPSNGHSQHSIPPPIPSPPKMPILGSKHSMAPIGSSIPGRGELPWARQASQKESARLERERQQPVRIGLQSGNFLSLQR